MLEMLTANLGPLAPLVKMLADKLKVQDRTIAAGEDLANTLEEFARSATLPGAENTVLLAEVEGRRVVLFCTREPALPQVTP